MRALRILIGILAGLVALSLVGLFSMGVLLYQVTPKSALAQQTFLAEIPGLLSGVRVLDRFLNPFFRGPRPPEPLPLYELRVSADDLRRIEEQLPTMLPSPWYGNLFLTEDRKDWVDGTFIADGKEYDVAVRVRGDLFDHWAYRKKSWRVRFKDGKAFRGMTDLSLIIPEDRFWHAELLNAHRAKALGLLVPPMRPIRVRMNGGPPMLYTEVEHFTKEMVEKQGRSGDSNLYGTGGGSSYFQQWDPIFSDAAFWKKYIEAPGPDTAEEVSELLTLSWKGAAKEPGYFQKLSHIVDVDRLVRWYAVSLLAGSRHVRDHNLRFLFDRTRGMFEPIPWDIGAYMPRTLLALPGNPFLNEALGIPSLRLAAYRMVWDSINDHAWVTEDHEEALRLRALMERVAYRDPLKLPSNRQVKREFDQIDTILQRNIDFLRGELGRAELVLNERRPSPSAARGGLLLSMDITARGVAGGRLHEISFPQHLRDAVLRRELILLRDDGDFAFGVNDKEVPLTLRDTLDKKERVVFQLPDDERALVWPGDPVIDEETERVLVSPNTRQRFFLVRRGGSATFGSKDLPLHIDLRNAVTGEKAQVIRDAIIDDATFSRLPEVYASRAEFLRRNVAFRPDGEYGVVLAGTPVFSETVIVPSTVRLRIAPGTRVRMGSGVTLLSYAPVDVVGTSSAPIIFEPATDRNWGVFLIANAEGQSRVAFAEFSGGSEAFINGIAATGMVAFHSSPVVIRDSTFRSSHGDDALNIKYVPVDIARAHFIDPDADTLDLDMPPSGVVEDTTILVSDTNTSGNGDGIDLSWAPVVIRRVTIEGSRDKCISVGEHSEPVIEDVILKRCHYGIVSKDSSHATVRRARFIDNDIAVGAYVKKSIFSGSSITVQGSLFEGNGKQQEALDGSTIAIQ
ncbi:CotH kinase family protein [Candidatus Peregrinibacteria bacterium]|nr:CotH kinase family protein [Candidatus Peregrinibacteria bacterium]